MKKKNEFITWVPLSPVEIYDRHQAMYEWSTAAEKNYEVLLEPQKEELNEQLISLLRKTSATEACKVIIKISESLSLPNLLDFCTQAKFSGLLGINHAVNITLDKLYFRLIKRRTISSFLGGIVIDFKKKCELGSMLECHDELQLALNSSSKENQKKFRELLTNLSSCVMQKKYPLDLLLGYGEEIKNLHNLYWNPIELKIKKLNINPKGKDFDFYSIAKDREDGGFFAYLCIVLLSLKF